MNATPEQKRASNPKASAWVSANAGSGKTHVLVDRVIRLMLEGVDPAAILCLTYTKAAATEMAARVHQRLGEWVGITDTDLTRQLQKLGSGHVSAETLARARRLFTAALETPGGFKIQTIHAFCERILQLFPVEAGMAPGFEVMEPKETSQLLESARDVVLFAAQRDEDSLLAQAFSTIVHFVQPDAFDGLLAGLLAKRRDLQDLLAQHGSLANICLELRRLLGVGPEKSMANIREQLLDFDRPLAKRVIATLSTSAKRTDQATAEILTSLLNDTDEAEAIFRRIFFLSTGTVPKQLNSIVTKNFQQDNPWIAQWLADESLRVTTLIVQRDNLARIEATQALLTLAITIITQFETAKQMRGAYDFEDLILRTRDLLIDRVSAQWVLYKLDRSIEHVLVDEAQDTSLAQWQIVNALTDEFFSGSGAREAGSRTLFVVGDRKQSIYSFQGADPGAFELSKEKFRAQINDIGQIFHDVDLTVSYRSTAEILQTVDAVFAEGSMARQGLDGKIPTVLHHESNRRDQAGVVELWPLIRPDGAVDREPWQAPVDREPAKSPKRMLARKIAQTVKSWLGKRQIAALKRAVEPGDILILFRTRNILFDALISELRKLGVAVAGADRLKLSRNIAVQDVMALIRFILLPADDYSLACIVKSPLVPKSLSDDQLFELAHGRGSASLWARLGHSSDVDCVAAHARLKNWRELGEHTRPFEFLSTVLVKTRKAILARLGSEASDALDALLESSLDYEEKHSSSLSGFADWFVSEDAEIKRNMESGRNEVRLMTIHGAKGMESNIVIMPDTTSLPNDRKSHGLMFVETEVGQVKIPLWRLSKLSQSATLQAWKDADTASDLEEYHRLLYVAMTRARDELYICGCHNDNDLADSSWYAMVETALLRPSEGQSSLRAIQSPDGSVFWRLGADPTAATIAASALWPAAEIPAWLQTGPTHPDVMQRNWTPTRLPHMGKAIVSLPAVNRGRVIHKILQEIPGLAEQDALKLARRLVEKNHLDSVLAEEIVGLICKPEYGAFFGPASQAEVSIGAVLSDGQRFAGRVDRLVIRPYDISVLDYKTDWNVPEKLSHTHSYVVQMAAYALALRQAYPNKSIKTALLWINAGRLDWISNDMLEEAISGIAAIT